MITAQERVCVATCAEHVCVFSQSAALSLNIPALLSLLSDSLSRPSVCLDNVELPVSASVTLLSPSTFKGQEIGS